MNKVLFVIFSIFIILLQLFVADNLVMRNAFSSYISPELYLYIVIALPFIYSPITVMLIAFMIGIILDTVSGTLGLHTAPLVLMGYIRNFFLKDMELKEEREKKFLLTIYSMGKWYFLKYAAIMIIIYHTNYFILESFQWNFSWLLFIRILSSSLVAFIMVLIFQLLPFDKE